MARIAISTMTPPSKELGLYVPTGSVLATAVGDFLCLELKRTHMHSCEHCSLRTPLDETDVLARDAICKRVKCAYCYRQDRKNVIFIDTRQSSSTLNRLKRYVKDVRDSN